ncbi:MAG: benzoate-CoA ligase family protein [Alphaproteobacteria bacterium]|nr:benzoate-CoA ligase family protein [Alphaproteobacteria bacterium]
MNTENGNAALYFVDRFRDGPQADKAAFEEGLAEGRSLSYQTLAAQTDQMAELYARHNIRPEDRAAMLVLDVIEFPVIFWGSIKAGVIPVPLNTLLSTDIYDAILRDCRARILFVSAELLDVVKDILADNPYLEQVIVVGQSDASYPNFAGELAASAPRPMMCASADETAFWLYSSGSTGRPKGVLHVHSSLQATADTYGARVLAITPDDRIFSAAKLFFAYGMGNGMTFPMSVGATAILYPQRPTPEAMFAVIARTKPTIFCGVPTLYAAMLAEMDGKKPAGADVIRRSISAGEALPADIGERWASIMGTDILDGVGSTELLHIFLSNAPDNVVYGTSGVAVPGYAIRLVNEAGEEVAQDEIGELLVNGPSAADGYWNQRGKSRATFAGVWTHTGDKYTRRADGRLVYCGRTDDMFKVSGIWVSPFEVEQALASHPDVLEAAVVAAQDDEGLDKPHAFIVLKPGASGEGLPETLKQLVKQRIGKWKYPRWIEIVDDLPKTATGKIQRFKLRG